MPMAHGEEGEGAAEEGSVPAAHRHLVLRITHVDHSRDELAGTFTVVQPCGAGLDAPMVYDLKVDGVWYSKLTQPRQAA